MTFSFSLFLTNFSLSALCIYPPAKYWLSQMNFLDLILEISKKNLWITKLLNEVIVKRLGLGLGLGLGSGTGGWDGDGEFGMGNGSGKMEMEMGKWEWKIESSPIPSPRR